jgi:Ca2+-dependent lipid-binding protein
VLNIILIDGSDLKAMDSNGLSDPYVKIKMDNEKYRSKVYNKIIINYPSDY